MPETAMGNLKVNDMVDQAVPNNGLETTANVPLSQEQYGSSSHGGPEIGPFDNQVPNSVALSRKDTAFLTFSIAISIF